MRVCLASFLFLIHSFYGESKEEGPRRQGGGGAARGEAPTALLNPAVALLEFTFLSTDQER